MPYTNLQCFKNGLYIFQIEQTGKKSKRLPTETHQKSSTNLQHTPMKTTIHLFTLLTTLINLFAQPAHPPTLDDRRPFLDCVSDTADFAKFAAEAYQDSFELMDEIHCKLHIPAGINATWQEVEKSGLQKKGEYNYTHDFWVGVRFNFYLDGTKVSTAYQGFEKPQKDTASFTLYFDLDPLDVSTGEGNLNYAYVELLKNLKAGNHEIVIEAAVPSKNLVTRTAVPFASGKIQMLSDDEKYDKWKAQLSKSYLLKREAEAQMIAPD